MKIKRTVPAVVFPSLGGLAAFLVGARVLKRGDSTFKKVMGLGTLLTGAGAVVAPWIFGEGKDGALFWISEVKGTGKTSKKRSSDRSGGACGAGCGSHGHGGGSCGSCGGCGGGGCGGGCGAG